MEIPLQYREAAETYQPIEFEGITLYPILVREFREFQNARPAIDFLQQSLPARYLSIPLLSAYFKMDAERQENEGKSENLFVRALLFLVLALRYKPELAMEERLTDFASKLVVAKDDHTVLKRIAFEQDGKPCEITPVLFQRMRPVLAAQNGIRLVSDDANPELVEAGRDIAEANAGGLDYDLYTLIAGVSALSGTEESEIYDWPISKLIKRQASYERVLQFIIFGIAQASGASFKGGNPVPSPFFEKSEKLNGALLSFDKVAGGKRVSVSQTAPEIPGKKP